MAYDATKPAVADNYSTGYTQAIRDNQAEQVKLFDGSSFTGTVPTGAKRYNATSDLFEYYTGAAWVEMPLAYLKLAGGTLTGTVNLTGGGTFQVGGNAVWHAGNLTPSNYMPTSGGTFSGAISTSSGGITANGRIEGNGGTGNGIGKVTVTNATSAPTGGAQGDLHFIWA